MVIDRYHRLVLQFVKETKRMIPTNVAMRDTKTKMLGGHTRYQLLVKHPSVGPN